MDLHPHPHPHSKVSTSEGLNPNPNPNPNPKVSASEGLVGESQDERQIVGELRDERQIVRELQGTLLDLFEKVSTSEGLEELQDDLRRAKETLRSNPNPHPNPHLNPHPNPKETLRSERVERREGVWRELDGVLNALQHARAEASSD